MRCQKQRHSRADGGKVQKDNKCECKLIKIAAIKLLMVMMGFLSILTRNENVMQSTNHNSKNTALC